jgi:putative endonuclease
MGEDPAASFLQRIGYEIVTRNYRFERGEIDIVALDAGVLVFAEVKTRRSKTFGEPEDSVTERKRRQLHKVAQGYLFQHGIENVECRFDVVSIYFRGERADIRHIKRAF